MKLSILIFLICFLPTFAFITKNEGSRRNDIKPKKFNITRKITGVMPVVMNVEDAKAIIARKKSERHLTMQRYRLMIAARLGTWLFSQSTSNNANWERDLTKFILFLNPHNFSAEICGINKKLSFFHFYNYLTEQRSRTVASDGVMRFNWEENEDVSDMIILIDYNVTSNWDYEIKYRWRISLAEVGRRNWKIFLIQQTGGCQEVGVAKNVITVDNQIFNIEPRIKAMQFHSAIVDKSQMKTVWKGMMDTGVNFKATVCTSNGVYTSDEFISYMELFLLMWDFDENMIDNEQTNFNVIMNSPDKYIFRHTLPAIMYMGEKGLEARENWELKVLMNYNSRGDGKWVINSVDLGCPVVRSTTDLLVVQYGKKMHHDIEKGVKNLIKSEVLWYDSFNFLTIYLKDQNEKSLMMEICGDTATGNYTYNTWKQFRDWNGKNSSMRTVSVDWNDVKINEKFEAAFQTITLDSENVWRLVNWRFYVEWDSRMSFFYVNRMQVSCPITDSEVVEAERNKYPNGWV